MSEPKFKVLQCDDEAAYLLGWARKQVLRAIETGAFAVRGAIGFSRTWIVGDVTVRAKCWKFESDFVAQLWLTSAGRPDPLFSLGTTVVLFAVTTSNQLGDLEQVNLAKRKDIHAALFSGRKVVHTAPYVSVGGIDYWVDFSDPSLAKPKYTSVVDAQAGQMYWLMVTNGSGNNTGVVKIDFDGNEAWYRDVAVVDTVSSAFDAGYTSFVATPLSEVNIGQEQVFDIARIPTTGGDLVIPDGDQTFNIDMAQGRFTMPITISFVDQLVDDIGSPVSFFIGAWKVTQLSAEITQNDAQGAKIALTYSQSFNNHQVHFVTDRQVIQTPGLNSIDWGFVPTGGGASFNDYVDLISAPMVDNDEPMPVVLQQMRASSSSDPITHEFHSRIRIYLTYLDGSSVWVSEDDPTTGIDFFVGDVAPNPTLAPIINVFGPNGATFNYESARVIHQFGDLPDFRDATWVTGAPETLGYSVRRTVPTRTGFPALNELYEILDPSGNVLRQAVRPEQVPSNFGGVESVDEAPALSNNPVHEEFSRVYRYTSPLGTGSPFRTFDAAVSILPNTDLCVIVDIDVVRHTEGASNIAMLPPGWSLSASGVFRVLSEAADANAANLSIQHYTDLQSALTISLSSIVVTDETADLRTRLTAMIAFVGQLKAAIAATAPNDIAGALQPLIAMYQTYASSESDQTFLPVITGLIAAFNVSQAPADFLSANSARSLLVSYLSAHMKLIANPTGYGFIVYLMAGPNTLVRARTT